MIALFSIILIIIALYIIIKHNNLVLSFFIVSAGLFLYYLIFAKIQIPLIFSQLNLVAILQFVSFVAVPIIMYLIYRTARRTKIFNDWLQLVNVIMPYNVQKLMLLFLLGQLFIGIQTNIFVYMTLLIMFGAALKLSRLQSALVILISLFLNLIVQSNSLFRLAMFNDLFELTDSLYTYQIAYIFFIFVAILVTLCLTDKFNYRHVVIDEKYKLTIKHYGLLTIFITITYTLSFLMLQLYFTLPVTHIYSSLVAIITLGVISKYGFNKMDFIDFDEFYQKKEDDRPLIISFIVLFFIVVASVLAFNGNVYLSLIVALMTTIFISVFYKIKIYTSDFFNRDLLFYIAIVAIFYTNNLVIVQSYLNNDNFNTNISMQLLNITTTTDNTIIDALLYILQYSFLSFNQLNFIISNTIADRLEAYVSHINIIAASFSIFTVSYVLSVLRVKKSDYTELLTILLVLITVLIVATSLLILTI